MTPWHTCSVFYTILFYAFVLRGEFGGSQFIYFHESLLTRKKIAVRPGGDGR